MYGFLYFNSSAFPHLHALWILMVVYAIRGVLRENTYCFLYIHKDTCAKLCVHWAPPTDWIYCNMAQISCRYAILSVGWHTCKDDFELYLLMLSRQKALMQHFLWKEPVHIISQGVGDSKYRTQKKQITDGYCSTLLTYCDWKLERNDQIHRKRKHIKFLIRMYPPTWLWSLSPLLSSTVPFRADVSIRSRC